MTMRVRATLAAIALSFGLLMVVGASSFKSTALIKHQRAVSRGEPSVEPDPSSYTPVMVLGWIVAAAGGALLGWTLRDMTRQIGDIQSRAEAQLRMEAMEKRDPKPKP
jgi:5-enolpyruvylshikimate-3-phosphate synthase